MFRSSSLDKTLDNACSHLRLEPDWPSIMLICDLIRQNDTTPKYAIQAVKKKLLSPNPHTAYYALLVLESVVKNCGSPIHDEVVTKENCEIFTQLIETTPHENVKTKMLELIQAWAYAFRTADKYQAIKDTMTILKTKGRTFPELKEADAMFTSDTAPIWHDGKRCNRCRVEFTFTQRKHHCRNCGQIFCAQCSAKTCTLPKFGIEKEVRVCDGCYILLQKPSSGTLSKRADGTNDLPAEYLNSSLAQQSQTPVRKTDQELKEEEELQLALALSQSEAEQKNRTSSAYRMPYRKTSSPETSINASPVAPILRSDSSPLSVSPSNFEDRTTDPELAKYLNRDYWEQRNSGISMNGNAKINEAPANPTAPSPMVTPQPTNMSSPFKNSADDTEIDSFSTNMKTQVEIFVNRMKSNSSRGRSISTDSSVQNLFLNLTAYHSRLLEYIKKADDKRMWFEQLQDKLTQIKDSRAALDVLRQEHQEKLRQQAEEQERQRQMQMAFKLELMRKKKQEYLQYQRQLALQRIQEQEREMKMHQDQQKVIYSMGVQAYGPNPGQYMPTTPSSNESKTGGSPAHIMAGSLQQPYVGINAINNYTPGLGLPTGSGFNPVSPPGSTIQRYPIYSQSTVYSTVGGQAQGPPAAAPASGMQSMPAQFQNSNIPGSIHLPQHMSPQANVGPHEFISGPPPPPQQPQQQQQQQNHLHQQQATLGGAPNTAIAKPNLSHGPSLQHSVPPPPAPSGQHTNDAQPQQQYQMGGSIPTKIEEKVPSESKSATNVTAVAEAELISFD